MGVGSGVGGVVGCSRGQPCSSVGDGVSSNWKVGSSVPSTQKLSVSGNVNDPKLSKSLMMILFVGFNS